jgi:hypothetical protein
VGGSWSEVDLSKSARQYVKNKLKGKGLLMCSSGKALEHEALSSAPIITPPTKGM